MKHLKIFLSMSEFEAAKPSMDIPFVVLEKGTPKVIFSNLPLISEDDLTDGDYVDLGLPSGLKWATCNIGASSPCESGLLFQFGRVDGYAYRSTNHKFSRTTPHITTSGKTYAAGQVLDPADDAAYVATNGKFRIPTVEEIDELLAGTTNRLCRCTVLGEDHTSHTVYGRLFTSKTNADAKIFIPAAGYYSGSNRSFYDAGSIGEVWSSSVHSSTSLDAWILLSGFSQVTRASAYLLDGLSVRGVKE